MKKTYDPPDLTTEPFDTDDVISASAPNPANTLGIGNDNWNIPISSQFDFH